MWAATSWALTWKPGPGLGPWSPKCLMPASPNPGLSADSRSGATEAPGEVAAGSRDTMGISFLSCPMGAGGLDTELPGM